MGHFCVKWLKHFESVGRQVTFCDPVATQIGTIKIYSSCYLVLLTQQSMANGSNCCTETHTVYQSLWVPHHQCGDDCLSSLASSRLPRIPGTVYKFNTNYLFSFVTAQTYLSTREIRLKCNRVMDSSPATPK